MSNLRVLLLTSQMGTGGAPRVALDICKYLKNQIKDLQVAYLGGNDGLVSQFEEIGIEVKCVGNHPLDPRNLFRVRDLVLDFNPDIINTHMTAANQVGRLVSTVMDVPVVTTLHMSWGNKDPILRTIDFLLSPASSKNITVSNAARDTFPSMYGLNSRLNVIHNCIDIREKIQQGDIPLEECEWYNRTVSKPIVGNVARFDPKKRRKDVIKSFSNFLNNYPTATLILTGDGKRRKKMEELAQSLGIRDSTVFCGHISNPQTVYAHSDIIIHASVSEAFSIAMLESMAHKKAIVATDIPPFREALGQNYDLVKPKQPKKLAEMMNKVMKNRKIRENLQETAFLRVKKYYSGEKSASEYLSIFEQVVARQNN